jgi:hypothetical protein
MKTLSQAPNMVGSSDSLSRWFGYKNGILTFAVLIMAIFAILKLGSEFYRLIWETGPLGAIDLNLRYKEVHYWFIGKPVYEEFPDAVYPPASYAILWPFLGWLSLAHARWLWAVTSVITLAWFLYLIVKESGAKQPLEQLSCRPNATFNECGWSGDWEWAAHSAVFAHAFNRAAYLGKR